MDSKTILIFRMLSEKEIGFFRSIKLSDVVKKVTTIGDDHIQENLFFFNDGDPCPQPFQLNASQLENCPFLKGYDYFQVSKIFSSLLFDSMYRFVCKYSSRAVR